MKEVIATTTSVISILLLSKLFNDSSFIYVLEKTANGVGYLIGRAINVIELLMIQFT